MYRKKLPSRKQGYAYEVFRIISRHSVPDGEDNSEMVEVSLDEAEFNIHLGHKGSSGDIHYLSTELESTGTQRLLVLLTKIFQVLDEGKVAFVDEVDASLHTSAVEAILKLFSDPEVNRKGAQLVATTHVQTFLIQRSCDETRYGSLKNRIRGIRNILIG